MRFAQRRRMYEALPAGLRSGVRLLSFSWLAGRSYRRVLGRQAEMDALSRQEIEALQRHELSKLLSFVTENVPAYGRYARDVERHDPVEVLGGIPFTTKQMLMAHPNAYLPRDLADRAHYQGSTGGTTATALTLYYADDSAVRDLAFIHRFWGMVGYTPRHRKAVFRSVSIDCGEAGVYWQANPIYNEMQFSAFHLHEGTAECYLEQIVAYRPDFVCGLASVIDVLAEYVLREGRQGDLPAIKAVFLGSEAYTVAQRERIERAFGARSFTWYGHAERVILGGECEVSQTYHSPPDYGYLEVAKDDDSLCEIGEYGELVGTGFNNLCMPLIRYRSGDRATRLEPACACGRHWDRFSKVDSHWGENMLICQSGRRVAVKRFSGTAIKAHHQLFEKVKGAQYLQEQVGEGVLKVVVAEGFSEADRLALEACYNAPLDDDLHMTVRVVDNLKRSAQGKLILLESRIDDSRGDSE